MASSDFIFDVTTEIFEAEVLEASFQTPILVDFWAPWCGPCRMLMPLLEKVVGELNGALKLAKVNADEEGQIAASFGVRSLPTVVLIKDGKPLDGFMGAQPEGAIRAFLAKHLTPIDQAAEEPEELAALATNVDLEQVIAQAREAVQATPDEQAPRAILADLLLRSGSIEEGQSLIEGLDETGRGSAEGARAVARLAFAQVAMGAPADASLRESLEANPNDLQARYQLGARSISAGQDQAALDLFLGILKADRKFEDDLGRRALVEAFKVVEDVALIGDYRRQMSSLLF